VRLVELHDALNPARVIPFDADDFSMAIPQTQGTGILRKDSDIVIWVHESSEEVMMLIQGSI